MCRMQRTLMATGIVTMTARVRYVVYQPCL